MPALDHLGARRAEAEGEPPARDVVEEVDGIRRIDRDADVRTGEGGELRQDGGHRALGATLACADVRQNDAAASR